MDDVIEPRRALLSVSDKTGIEAFAAALAARGVEIVSTGGTARALREAGIAVREVADLTGAPEMMGGRVKTLHPVVHGGLLARRGADDADLEAHGIGAIDLAAVNLYPFEETVASGAAAAECVEQIDIGGPAMIRAAAKNHDRVAVATDPAQYEAILAAIEAEGGTGIALRRRLAAAAYARTAAYDVAVAGWMAAREGGVPERIAVAGTLRQALRYGENPHQSAAFYVTGGDRPGVATAEQVQGKALSYNNLNDTDAAFEAVAEIAGGRPACVIVKHANPCAAALGASAAEAFGRALGCDRTSAFGGIVASSVPLDGAAAEAIAAIFTEVVIAPGADEAALAVFADKPGLRLLLTDGVPRPDAPGRRIAPVSGGMLVQDRDAGRIGAGDLRVVTARAPSEEELADMLFAWRVAKHVKSNAIVYAKDGRTVGVGAGQMSRVDSSRIAARKAAEMGEALGLPGSAAEGSAVASDAFFPFADGLEAAVEAGARAVIQPGGSKRDAEVIAAADAAGVAMAFTGMRHFRH